MGTISFFTFSLVAFMLAVPVLKLVKAVANYKASVEASNIRGQMLVESVRHELQPQLATR